MQEAFREHHALQCGYCTPGMVMAAVSLLAEEDQLDERGVREGLEGNLCRCTGYNNIVKAVLACAGRSWHADRVEFVIPAAFDYATGRFSGRGRSPSSSSTATRPSWSRAAIRSCH